MDNVWIRLNFLVFRQDQQDLFDFLFIVSPISGIYASLQPACPPLLVEGLSASGGVTYYNDKVTANFWVEI